MRVKNIFLITFSCLCIYYFRSFIILHEDEIAEFVEKATPPKYTPDNHEVSTTSFPYRHPESSFNESDTQDPWDINIEELPPDLFTIDDTEHLRSLNLACQPESYGYSIEQGSQIFPFHGYPSCSSVNNQNKSFIYINKEENRLYMDCPGDFKGRYVLGPLDERKLVTREEIEDLWEVREYKEPELIEENVEFALGSCDEDSKAFYKQGHMTPRFNQTLYEQAKLKTIGRPKIIFMLVLDSMSRRHFFRKLPKMIDFLNSLNHNSSDFWAFDFKLHNIIGPNSVANQVPIFGGKENYADSFEGDQNVDHLGSNALWNVLREKGYVNFFGFESCDFYFPKSLGRKPNFDYSVNPFFCAIYKYTDFKLDKDAILKQRCLGPFMSHRYPLNYTKEFIDMNLGVNMFLYLHLNGGHEGSGLHAETMDQDVTNYLRELLTKHGKDNDIVLLLHADHGMRYGNWYKDLPAYQEQKLPSLFFITQREYLKTHEKGFTALTVNTERLTSKMDLRKTILHVAGIEEKTKYGVNLLTEIASKDRTCPDAGIDPWDCSCTEMELIINPDSELRSFLWRLAELLQTTINSESFSSKKHVKGLICEKVVVERISKAYNFQISNVEEFFRLEVTIHGHSSVKFQANIIVSSYISDSFKRNKYKYTVETSSFRKAPVFMRVNSI